MKNAYFCACNFQNSRMKKLFLAFLFILLHPAARPQQSATQIRAVWLTTNWQLDWPSSGLSAEGQKRQLVNILDSLQKLNFNTVLFQARIRGSVLYRSQMEPMSAFVRTSSSGEKPFDPLAFAVEECHKRNMECHAWIVTYPLGSKASFSLQKRDFLHRNKEMCKLYKGEWYLDPGNPKTDDYLTSIVREIVEGYDVDGIHFDYIRYPDENANFPDQATFRRYGEGQSLGSWRRANVTRFVTQAYNYVKKTKPWVQVSSSPIGIYRSLTGRGDQWSGFESVFQDSYNWLKIGVQDAVYPMMYYEDKHFYPYVADWLKNANGRFVVPGLGVYKMLSQEQNWELHTVTRQIDFVKSTSASGEAYFRLGMILGNLKGIKDELLSYYRNPAKLPPMNWLNNEPPAAPTNFQIYRTDSSTVQLSWDEAPSGQNLTYTVYAFYPTDSIDLNNPESIVASGLRKTSLALKLGNSPQGKYYAVSASNRFHIEGRTCEIAYFLPSLDIQK